MVGGSSSALPGIVIWIVPHCLQSNMPSSRAFVTENASRIDNWPSSEQVPARRFPIVAPSQVPCDDPGGSLRRSGRRKVRHVRETIEEIRHYIAENDSHHLLEKPTRYCCCAGDVRRKLTKARRRGNPIDLTRPRDKP
jgi:hypothetical protein